MRHVWVPDAGNVVLVGVLNLKMYALWGAPLTRANGYINFSKCMQAWEGLRLNPIDLFFLGNLLKPMGKPGDTWGHRKYSALKTPLAYAFGFFGKQTRANCKHIYIYKYKHMQLRSSTHRSHSEDWPSSQKMAEIYLILNILRCMHCRGYQWLP